MGYENKTRRYARPGRRDSKGGLIGTGTKGVSASSLAKAAGLNAERATVEQLERRQMLFSLTVTSDSVDATTGIGQARAYIGYFIPPIASNFQASLTPAVTTTETFNDEIIGPVANNQLLAGQGIRLRTNIVPFNDFAISATPLSNDNPEKYLRVNPNEVGESFEYRFFSDTEAGLVSLSASSFSVDISGDGPTDGTGLFTNSTRIEFLQGETVVGSITGGAAIRALFAPGVGNPAVGIGTMVINAPTNVVAFSGIRFVLQTAPGAGATAFRMDNATYVQATSIWAGLLTPLIRGAAIVLNGPVGTSATFTDLNGNDMVRTIRIGQPEGSQLLLGDPNGDGRPDFNYGIGSIRLSGTDQRSSFTIWGASITATTVASQNAEFFENGFELVLDDEPSGTFSELESTVGFGLGYNLVNNNFTIIGLPTTGGSVVIGSPFRIGSTNAAEFGILPGAQRILPATGSAFYVREGFTNPNQGIFLDDGSSIGSITVHGALMGSSRFTGAVGRLNVGYLLGSVSVAGDLGQLNVQSDAGSWEADVGSNITDGRFSPFAPNKTGAQLFVGRTVGEINIGGRSLLDITVLGDVNSPTTRPPLFNSTYDEREFVYGVPTTSTRRALIQTLVYTVPSDIPTSNNVRSFNGVDFLGRTVLFGPQPVPYGGSFSRNDSLLSAEWIGSSTGSLRIRGDVSGIDTFNTGEDKADVYAFAVDGLSEVDIQLVSFDGLQPSFRLVDGDGRVLAAPRLVAPQLSLQNGDPGPSQLPRLQYRPSAPGVVYLIVADTRLSTDTTVSYDSYTMNVSGMATTTVGALRTSGGASGTARLLLNNGAFFTNVQSTFNVLSGNVGSLRLGTGLFGVSGSEESPTINYNENDNGLGTDGSMSVRSGSYSISGNLYNITTGADIDGAVNGGRGMDVRVGGSFGSLLTGASELLVRSSRQGDVDRLNLLVGGPIALVDIRGGVGVNQDAGAAGTNIIGSLVQIKSGQDTRLRGDIGQVRTGYRVYNDSLRITTPPGSDIGAVLIGQDTYSDINSGLRLGIKGLPFITGAGSNIKFFDTPFIDLLSQVGSTQPIFGSTALTLIDDGGAEITIEIPDAPTTQILGSVVYMPVDGSQGGAIAQISVNLNASQGGAEAGWRLVVRSSNPVAGPGGTGGSTSSGSKLGTVGIGRIVVTDGNLQSSIEISGDIETDVLRIQQTLGTGVGFITNSTPDGDFVAVDVAGLNTLEVSGDLGRTELPSWGPQQLGPWLGFASSLTTTLGGEIGFPVTGALNRRLIDPNFTGSKFQRAVNDDAFDGADASLDDIGLPFDGYLNGLIVREGSVTEVRANGAIGDVILQGNASVLQSVNANRDLSTRVNRFDGIIGGLFAKDIGSVNIGQGLAAQGPSPYAAASIAGWNSINRIFSSTPNAEIRGVIVASGGDPLNTPAGQLTGINSIELVGGGILNADIQVATLDRFWQSYDGYGESFIFGDIGLVSVSNANVFGTRFLSLNFNQLTITNGYLDATLIEVFEDLTAINVAGIRNSTTLGLTSELKQTLINVGQNIGRITVGPLDLADISVNVVGDITQGVSAPNILRSSFNVANTLQSLNLTGSLKASSFVVGQLPTFTVARDVLSSEVTVSGKLTNATIQGAVSTSSFNITGPDGELGTLLAANGFNGEIRATGPIGSITVPGGDLRGRIVTTTTRGSIGTITAGGDVAIQSDIAGAVTSITAGRNVGDRAIGGSIIIRSGLATLTAPNGQLYADLRVTGTLGTVTLGAATAKPGANLVGSGSIVASGRIANVVINGDFGGSIISYSGGIGAIAINQGSLLPGTTVQAVAGNISSLIITNGNLYGNVRAEYDITLLRVLGQDGVFGDIGVSPLRSAGVSYDARRNQLPVGVAADGRINGPRITAGHDIVSIEVPNGFVFETQFRAGRSIRNVAVAGTIGNDGVTAVRGTWFAAGDSIDNVVAGGLFDTNMYAGLIDLGSDDAPGGTGLAADTVRAGVIRTITAIAGAFNDTLYAGVSPGANGRYGDADDRFATGVSSINTLALGGSVSNVVTASESVSAGIAGDARITKTVPVSATNPLLDAGTGTPGTAFSGTQTFVAGTQTITVTFSGPGQAFFQFGVSDQTFATPRLTLRNTTAASAVSVFSSTGTLSNFDIVTNNNASVGTISLLADVNGDSDILVDADLGRLSSRILGGTGNYTIGGTLTRAEITAFSGGFLDATSAGVIAIASDFGAANSAVVNEARIDLINSDQITIGGASRGLISVERNATSIAIGGISERAQYRIGWALGTFSAASMNQSLLAATEAIASVNVAGDMFDSDVAAGVNAGTDAAFGGTGRGSDSVTAASIGPVIVGGNFRESNVTAGYLRGADGFFGTSDDVVASGRSTISAVTVRGSQVGSARNSETYVVASSGTVGTVSVGGAAISAPIANFSVRAEAAAPQPVAVTSLRTDYVAGQYRAQLLFNQPIDFSTASRAINISEVRGTGDVLIRLVEGTDYTLVYDATTQTITATFSRNVTSRNLPAVPGVPGPGIYRFDINQSIFRAKAANARLDGNGDGQVAVNDNYSQDAVIGDAGDKINAGFTTDSSGRRVDFYSAPNLDILFDNNYSPDGLSDTNKVFTVRGVIGDHPDQDPNFFRPAGDTDAYRITLQAGQILRLGSLSGSAPFGGLSFLASDGNFVNSLQATFLQGKSFQLGDTSAEQSYLILQTGVYYVVVGNPTTIASNLVVNNPPNTTGGELGAYSFDIQVFDDGDSGFTGPTNSGDGTRLIDAPAPIQFAGPDSIFGTPDDRTSLTVGGSTFTWSRGADGLPNTADDVVTGGNGSDQTSVRTGFSSPVTTIRAAIGQASPIGVPSAITPDVDVFHLNNRQVIPAGTKVKLTVKLSQFGSDLGSADPTSLRDQRGVVQLGLFETTDSISQNDALLVFSPTEFLPFAGTPNRVLADNGQTKYGFDANGDFYIEFLAPESQRAAGGAGTFAAYVQGLYNTEYALEVVTGGLGERTKVTQNVLIETAGGTIPWLRVDGTELSVIPFNSATLGFTGSSLSGQPIDQYILSSLITNLTAVFNKAFPDAAQTDLDVRFSTNPSDFEFQPFSTVYLTSSADPLSPLLVPSYGLNFQFFNGAFSTQPYGYSQHADPLNADLRDNAVVFVPSLSYETKGGQQTEADALVQSLTAAVTRRVGELMGLRITDVNSVALTARFDPLASDGPTITRTATDSPNLPIFALSSTSRRLSLPGDSIERTDFFIGRQNAASLLDRVLLRR